MRHRPTCPRTDPRGVMVCSPRSLPDVRETHIYPISGRGVLVRQRSLGTHVVAHLDADSESPADTVDHLLVSTHAASPGTVRSFRIDYLLPKSAGNGYQGANA